MTALPQTGGHIAGGRPTGNTTTPEAAVWFFERLRTDLTDAGCDPRTVALYINEARFGYALIADRLTRADLKILEVGAGICALSLFLATLRHQVHAVEPTECGFAKMRPILDAVRRRAAAMPGFVFHDTKIQDLEIDEKFDLIFSVNVFEHLDDVDSALAVLARVLAPAGSAMLALPNYHVPYEPHYALPVVINKAITYRLFHKRIERFDAANGTHGLWDSLNLMTITGLRRKARSQNLRVDCRPDVTTFMFDRLRTDPEFRARHSRLRPVLDAMTRLRLPGLIDTLPPALQPYTVAWLSHELAPDDLKSDRPQV